MRCIGEEQAEIPCARNITPTSWHAYEALYVEAFKRIIEVTQGNAGLART